MMCSFFFLFLFSPGSSAANYLIVDGWIKASYKTRTLKLLYS
jgi:hypothetical protein